MNPMTEQSTGRRPRVRPLVAVLAVVALAVACVVGWRVVDSSRGPDPYVQGCAAWMHEDQPSVSVDEWVKSCEQGFADGSMERRDWMLDYAG